jgi:signal peptidase I
MLLSALRVTRIGFRTAWLFGVLALITLTAMPALLHVAGLDTYTVRGGSMSPSIPIGSIVVVEHVPADAVRASDVITFTAPNATVVTHRVLGRTADSAPTFITQGDANSAPDPDFVASASVIGRVVWSVPFLGAALVALSSTAGIVVAGALLVSLMVGGWFIDELGTLVVAGRARRAATELAG